MTSSARVRREGIVRAASKSGVVIKAALPDARLGERCAIVVNSASSVPAEVIGFSDEVVHLMPFGSLQGLQEGARVIPASGGELAEIDGDLRGCVLNAHGRITQRLSDHGARPNLAAIEPTPMDVLSRPIVRERLVTGVKIIDALFPLGKGQRVGIFAGAGVGKSTLLGMLTRYFRDTRLGQGGLDADADRTNRSIVVALIGERQREVREFLENDLGAARAQATVVVSTSDEPAVLRLRAAHIATAIAERERAMGRDVLLLMDSVTRFARAVRDLGLALEEAPGRGGYPPSVFAELPRLFERAGNTEQGSITAIYTVLMDSTDGSLDVVAEEVKSLLDGHLYLRPLGDRVRWRPGIDVFDSVSRVRDAVIDAECASPEEAERRIACVRLVEETLRSAYEFRRNPDDFRPVEGRAAFDRRLAAITGRALFGGTETVPSPLLPQNKSDPPVPLDRTLQLLGSICAQTRR